MKLATRLIPGCGPLKETRLVIEFQGVPVGLLTHFANTRTEEHPWKLFLYDCPVGEWVPGETEAKMVTVSYGKPGATCRRELLRIAAEKLTAMRAVYRQN
jgi:hypothetical protein